MTERTARKRDNFALALGSLERALAGSKSREVEIAGIIQMFEFTYEACWKLLKAMLEEGGIAAEYPKKVFVEAYGAGWIDNEEEWLRMVEDRNRTAHTYKKKTADEILARIETVYVRLFAKLRERSPSLLPPPRLPH